MWKVTMLAWLCARVRLVEAKEMVTMSARTTSPFTDTSEQSAEMCVCVCVCVCMCECVCVCVHV